MSFNECTTLIKNFQNGNRLDINFFDYVYSKIARDQTNRFVERNIDSIDIIPPQNEAIKVIPLCKKINTNNLRINSEIKKAVDLIQSGEIKHIYFVYPKNENFTKHIQVKVPLLEEACKDEYLIKIIPYSLNTMQKKCQCS